MFRNIFLIGLILIIVFAGLRSGGEEIKQDQVAKSSVPSKNVDELAPARFDLIPSSDPMLLNYRSAQPTKAELEYIIQQYGIEVVVRLNGDEGSMTEEREKHLADSLDVQFVRINAHLKDQGPGYDGSAKVLANFLRGGQVLVHCQHGYDRVGALVGHWLSSNGFSQEEVIAHNKWEGYLVRKGEKYRPYWITALQILEPESVTFTD